MKDFLASRVYSIIGRVTEDEARAGLLSRLIKINRIECDFDPLPIAIA